MTSRLPSERNLGDVVRLDRMILSNGDSAVDWRSNILACAFGTHFLFGSVFVLNTLGLSFFYYFPRKIQLTIIDPRIDLIVWAVSVFFLSFLASYPWKKRRRDVFQIGMSVLAIGLIIVLLMYERGGSLNKTIVYLLFMAATAELPLLVTDSRSILKQSRGIFLSRVLIYFLVYFVAIEVSSGIHYIMRAFDQSTQIGRVDARIELQFSYASYGLLPWIYVTFLFSWAWVPIVLRLLRRTNVFQPSSNSALISHQKSVARSDLRSHLSFLFDYRLFLALAAAAFIGYYPYFENPPWLVGTDAYWRYYDPLLQMNEKGIVGGFVQALGERHPLPLTILYMAQLMFHATPFDVVRLAPIVLVAALGFATWWLLARKKTVGFGLVVFALSIMSVTTTVGMYSNILANWMALIVWMAFFAYMAFRGDEKFRVVDAIVLLLMSTVILFMHPWTWSVFAASILLVAIASLFKEKRKGLAGGATLISIILIDVLLAFVSLSLLEASQGWRIADTFGYYTEVINNPASVLLFWDALTRLTQVWSPFFSPLYMAASILGVFYLHTSNLTPWRRRLILAWICTSAIGSILVAPIGFDPTDPTRSETQLWRLLFVTPFQLTAPFGITMIIEFLRKTQSRSQDFRGAESIRKAVPRAFLVGIFVVGVLLAWLPVEARLILAILPVVTGLIIKKAGKDENELLTGIILASFVLVAFNCATRGLSQLLIDPHNYRP